MATPPGGRQFLSHGGLDGGRRPPSSVSRKRQRPNKEVNEVNEVNDVIDLSTCSPEPCSTATAPLAGAKLSDFAIGERLGATRDGGEGFQVH